MSIVRYQTFRAWAEDAKTEERKIFEVTPTWRGGERGMWAAVLPEMAQVGFHSTSAEIAVKDMLMRNGWRVVRIRALEDGNEALS